MKKKRTTRHHKTIGKRKRYQRPKLASAGVFETVAASCTSGPYDKAQGVCTVVPSNS